MSIKQDRTGARTAADLERKYAFGQTFADVYKLAEDAKKIAEQASESVDGLDHEEIFNRLTNYGEWQGVYRSGDNIYMNASYIKTGKLSGANLEVDAATIKGKLSANNVDASELKVNAANITGTLSAGQINTTNLSVSAANITGTLSASQIDTTYLSVDAANIEGILSADYVSISGALSIDGYGYIGYVDSSSPDGDTYGVGVAAGSYGAIITTGGARLTGPSSQVLCAGSIWLDTVNSIKASTDITVTSDRRAKDDIRYNVDDYLAIFDALKPATFLWLNRADKRRHLGMIAQEVEEAMLNAGFERSDFAPLNIDEDGRYGITYGEFIPLLVAKVQQLDAEVKELRQNG